ncbi:alpha/beta fold hydrolase [Aquimarina agarivorans]|uniref:alpha/beta fold hydrolase n=1 Tax=Aquimarina agarivorans TaxID=980584 RepID=UPI000248F5E2|nr:alpha/beta fold hydrolase [Aquimarina agarivorans]
MDSVLTYISIENYTTYAGETIHVDLSYQLFGPPLGKAPVVLVTHALTGNSQVSGSRGWWTSLVGAEKVINTNKYTIIAFNIPGNGYDGKPENLYDNYKIFTAKDIARLFSLALKELQVTRLFANVGGSLGGGIAWELSVLQPNLAKNLVVVATDWKATDWVIANTKIQDAILLNSNNPLHDARMHAMLMYRTPESFTMKFNRTKNESLGMFNIESWLQYHGKKLEERFQLSAYKQLNYILSTIDVSLEYNNFKEAVYAITADIHVVTVDSDALFTLKEDKVTVSQLREIRQRTGQKVTHQVIRSIHGHDAFLIEYDQLDGFLEPIFK